MKSNHLIVSECFYSIQGEGQTMGIPAVFLRLAGCNLLCESKEWRCDTIEVWQKGKSTPFEEVLELGDRIMLKEGAHLVITGGEPLLHQEAIVDFLNWFQAAYKFMPIIEIETNGTIIPRERMLDKVDYWNVSPKLSNSGEPYEKRVNAIALNTIKQKGRDYIFKWVISREEDPLEILDEYDFLHDVKIGSFMLMPAGSTQVELERTRPITLELCKRMCWRYSERLHIVAWNKKTGV